jgi:hypothetical protein
VTPNTNVRPTVQAQPTTVTPNTNVRPTVPTTMAPVRPVTTGPVVTTTTPTLQQPSGAVRCSPTISRVPQGGYLVLRGSNLAGATAVTIGAQSAPIQTRTNEEIRARLVGVSGGGAVSIVVGGQTYACGRVEIVGR